MRSFLQEVLTIIIVGIVLSYGVYQLVRYADDQKRRVESRQGIVLPDICIAR